MSRVVKTYLASMDAGSVLTSGISLVNQRKIELDIIFYPVQVYPID